MPPLNRLRDNVTAELRNGLKIPLVDIHFGEFSLLEEVVFDDIYGIKDLPDPKVIVDLGANIGTFTLQAAKRFPNATVYAYEPDHEFYRRLCQNIQLNNITNVETFNFGVASKSHLPVYVRRSIDEPDPHLRQGKPLTYPCIPLSSIPKCDVLKCDIEGEEESMFQNPTYPIAIFELHQENSSLFEKFKDYTASVHRTIVTFKKKTPVT